MLLITICARGGSKGVPHKNIRITGNKPLISYTIEIAKEIAKIHHSEIALSTDSNEIIEVADNLGLKTDYKRPANLATDDAGKIPVIHDLVLHEEKRNNTKFTHILDLDVTSPLRTVNDIERAYMQLMASDAYNIISASNATKNPYFNMFELENGYAVRSKKPKSKIFSRQNAPKVYVANASFYIYKREFFERDFPQALTDKTLLYIMDNICFDIDEELDFIIMDYLLENKIVNTK